MLDSIKNFLLFFHARCGFRRFLITLPPHPQGIADLPPQPERFQNLTDRHILQRPEFQSGGPSEDCRVKGPVSVVPELGFHAETVQHIAEQVLIAAQHRPDHLAGKRVHPFSGIMR